MERFMTNIKKRDKVKDRKVMWNVTVTTVVGWYFPPGDSALSVANADVSLPATKSGASITNTTDS